MSPSDPRLEIEITLVPAKGRCGGRKSGPKVADQPRIPRITRLMALAIKFQEMVERGEVRDYADLARLGYVSRARLTQIMNLLLLASDLQERLLLSPNAVLIQERHLRNVVKFAEWHDQRKCFMPAAKIKDASR